MGGGSRRKAGRLEDALERQKRLERRWKKEKAKQRILERRAEMLRNAVSVDDLKEQLRVLQQLEKQSATHGSRGAGKHRGDAAKQDPLRQAQMRDLMERVAILEGTAEEEAQASSDEAALSDDDSSASDSAGESHQSQATSVVGSAAVDPSSAWGQFFSSQPNGLTVAAAVKPVPRTLYGLNMSQQPAASANKGTVSLVAGGGVKQLVPRSALLAAKKLPSETTQRPTVDRSAPFRVDDPLASTTTGDAEIDALLAQAERPR